MSGIALNLPWDSQPQDAVELDWGNPLAVGVRAADIPAIGPYLRIGAPTLNPTSKGIAFKGDGSSQAFYRDIPGSVAASDGQTVMALVMGAQSTDRRCYGLADASSYIFFIGSSASTATKMRLWYRAPNTDIVGSDTSATVFEDGVPHLAVMRFQNGVLDSFVDGIPDSSVSGSPAGTSAALQVGISGLVRASSGAAYAATNVVLGVFWGRALTDAEIRQVSADPWQLFAPRQIWIPTTAAASFNPTLSLPTYVPGSLTSSAFRPRVTATWS